MRSVVLGVLVVSMMSGCHGRFRRAAPDLEAVRTQVISEQRPSVRLPSGGSELGLVVDVVQGVKAVDVERKLQRSVDVDQMNEAFVHGLDGALGQGPPFVLTEKKKAPVLQVEVVDYGVLVPSLGAQGVFTYELKVRLYDVDGRRIYKTRVACDAPIGDPKGISRAVGTVNNAKQIDEMRRKEIQAAFDDAAWSCGNELVTRMRKHASPGLGADFAAAVADVDRGWE